MESNTGRVIELQKRYKVKNICDWDLGIGAFGFDILIKANSVMPMKGEDIDLLISNNNVFFWGTGNGDHAKIIILDEELKKFLELDKQKILNKEKIEQIIALKTDGAFEKNVEDNVVETHEKEVFYNFINKKDDFAGLSAKKLKFVEAHLGRVFE